MDADDSAAIDATAAMTANDLIIGSVLSALLVRMMAMGAAGRAVLLFRDLNLSGAGEICTEIDSRG